MWRHDWGRDAAASWRAYLCLGVDDAGGWAHGTSLEADAWDGVVRDVVEGACTGGWRVHGEHGSSSSSVVALPHNLLLHSRVRCSRREACHCVWTPFGRRRAV